MLWIDFYFFVRLLDKYNVATIPKSKIEVVIYFLNFLFIQNCFSLYFVQAQMEEVYL